MLLINDDRWLHSVCPAQQRDKVPVWFTTLWNVECGAWSNPWSFQYTANTYAYFTGWWFGTFFIFPHIGKKSPNCLIFLRGVQKTHQYNHHLYGWDSNHEKKGWFMNKTIKKTKQSTAVAGTDVLKQTDPTSRSILRQGTLRGGSVLLECLVGSWTTLVQYQLNSHMN